MTKSNFIIVLICGILTLVAPLVFGHDALASVAALTVLSIILVAINFSKSRLIVYLIVFFAGPISEMIAIYFGAWNYAHPDLLGIPYWLPFVWGNASLYIIDWHAMISEYVKEDLKKVE
jgi:hypothetical protein